MARRFDWGGLARALAPDQPHGGWTLPSIALRTGLAWAAVWLIAAVRAWPTSPGAALAAVLVGLAPGVGITVWIGRRGR
ncbi:hypothetical protein ACO2Q3_19990 [Caulobacter sp. KR2-114]|uniref:hypothetical protein n=1 Tax=Caulobacter sp. KR2-114 TaxID=3400912 RepID=UPI003C03C069